MTTLLEATDIVVDIGGSHLVAHVSLTQTAGAVTAILGPNGAGKSTLLSVLAGDRRPTTGSVRFGGILSGQLSPLELARHRSVLRQTRAFDIPFTVWEVVMMGRHPYRRDPDHSAATDDSAVAESLERCDVLELRDRTFFSLSGGEQARVSMARVLAQRTPLILLDEPSGGLDVGHEVLLLRELRNLAEQGRGVIAVFHDLNSAAALADRVILLHRGRVAGQGTVEQVMDENTLSEVYGQPLRVLRHPFRDIPLVLPER